jgi:hypothetical protein
LRGAFQFANGGNNKKLLGQDKQERIDLLRNDPTCALAKTDANTATVDATLRVTEEW